MSRNRIVELAAQIAEDTTKIDAYLVSHDLPTPSFDISAPLKLHIPPDIQSLHDAVLEASDELTALLSGPARIVANHPHNSWVSVQAIKRFEIANSFPVGETSSFTAIARSCGLPESDVRRLLRHAMTFRIFYEPSEGVVAHTAASKALSQVQPLGHLVDFLSGEMWPSATRLVDALERWPGSEEPNEAGFNLAFHTDKPMFDVVGRDPIRAQRMAGAMSFMHAGAEYHIRHLLEGFEWGDSKTGVLVDVGGGQGAVGIEIARYLTDIKCIVQDLPDVIRGVEVPEDLRDRNRLRFMEHDFFKDQPIAADVFLLRWVLHDWSDKYAAQILQRLRPGLKKGTKVIIVDLCLPPPCVLSLYKERSIRAFDLAMKGIQNAKERDADEWRQLFEVADARFKVQSIRKPAASALSFVHAVWEPK